uniref:Membrane-associated protein n=1 Tax=Macrostomum lignano TaxID=282301 RepID=A0A1I8G2V1_9PLAT
MPRRCLQTAFVALAACLLCAVQHAACQAPEPFCSCVPLTTKYFFTTPPTTTTATTTTQTTTTPTTSTTATTTTTAQSTTSKICAAVNGMVDKNYIPDAAISGARVGPAGEFRITKGDQMVVNYLAENNCLSGGGTFTIRLCIGGNIQSALVSYRSSENGRFVPMPGSAAASVNAPNSKLCFDINMLIVELAFQPLTLKPTVKNAKWGTFTGWSVNKSAVMEIDLVLGSCRSPILVHRLCVNGNVKQAHILFRSVSTAIFTELSSSLDVVSDALDLCYNISTTVAQFAIFPVQLKSSFSSCSPFNGLSSNAYLPEFAIWGAVLDPGTGYNMLRVSSGYLNIDLTVFGCRSHSVYIDQVCLLGNVKQAGLQLKRSIGGSFEASSLSNTVTGDLMSNNLCYTIRQNITAIRIAPSLLKSYDTCPLVEGIQNPLVIPNMDIAFEGSRDSISGAFYMQPGRLMIIDVSARGCRPATYVSQPNNYNYSNYNYHNYTYNYNANNSNDIIDNNHNYSNYNFDNSNHANYDCNHYYDFYCDYYTVHNFNNFYHYDHNTYNDVNNANYNKHHDHNTNNKHINHYNNAYYNYYNYDADYNINHDNKHNYNSNVPNTSTYGVKICLLGGNVRRANLFIRQSALHSLEPYASLTSDTQVCLIGNIRQSSIQYQTVYGGAYITDSSSLLLSATGGTDPLCFTPPLGAFLTGIRLMPLQLKAAYSSDPAYRAFLVVYACFGYLDSICFTVPTTTTTTAMPITSKSTTTSTTTATTLTTAKPTTTTPTTFCPVVNGLASVALLPMTAVTGAVFQSGSGWIIPTSGSGSLSLDITAGGCREPLFVCLFGNVRKANLFYRTTAASVQNIFPNSLSQVAENFQLCYSLGFSVAVLQQFEGFSIRISDTAAMVIDLTVFGCRSAVRIGQLCISGNVQRANIHIKASAGDSFQLDFRTPGITSATGAPLCYQLDRQAAAVQVAPKEVCVSGNVRAANMFYADTVGSDLKIDINSPMIESDSNMPVCYNPRRSLARIGVAPLLLKTASRCPSENVLSSTAYLPTWAITGGTYSPITGYSVARGKFLTVDLTANGCRAPTYVFSVCMTGGNVKQSNLYYRMALTGGFSLLKESETATLDTPGVLCYTFNFDVHTVIIAPGEPKSSDNSTTFISGHDAYNDAIGFSISTTGGGRLAIDLTARNCRSAIYVDRDVVNIVFAEGSVKATFYLVVRDSPTNTAATLLSLLQKGLSTMELGGIVIDSVGSPDLSTPSPTSTSATKMSTAPLASTTQQQPGGGGVGGGGGGSSPSYLTLIVLVCCLGGGFLLLLVIFIIVYAVYSRRMRSDLKQKIRHDTKILDEVFDDASARYE